MVSQEFFVVYDEFLNGQDIYNFESDLGKNNYKKWVEKYPQHLISIFGSLLSFNGNYLKEEDIVYFIDKGVNLNIPSKAYTSELNASTVLVFACEHRYFGLIQYLLKLGANINQRAPNLISPLESGLMGHGIRDIFKIEEAEHFVQILQELKVEKKIRKFILDDYCQEYLEKSKDLSRFLLSCELI